jgi:hypothetical protein
MTRDGDEGRPESGKAASAALLFSAIVPAAGLLFFIVLVERVCAGRHAAPQGHSLGVAATGLVQYNPAP